MEKLSDTPVLQFHPDTLQNVRKLYNYEDPKKLNEAIDILQEWARKQPHFTVKEFERDLLERIIMANKGLLERCKSRLDKLCTLKTLMPDLFKPINVMKDLNNVDYIQDAAMPQLTPENHRVYIIRNNGKHVNWKSIMDYHIRLIKFNEYTIRHDYRAGLICVYDFSEANLMEIVTSTTMNANHLRQVVTILMEGFGTRLVASYTISDSKLVSTLLDLVKPMLSKKMADRLHVLNSKELLKEKLPIDILPVEYGGKEKPLAELHQNWLKEASSDGFIEYLKKMSETNTDESLRAEGKFNEEYAGMAGTFRTLTVD